MTDRTKEREQVEQEVLSRGEMSDALDVAFTDDCTKILQSYLQEDDNDPRLLAYLGYSAGWVAAIAWMKQKRLKRTDG